MTVKNDGIEKLIIVDTGSSVTTLPPDKKITKDRKFSPITTKNQDITENEVKHTGKL